MPELRSLRNGQVYGHGVNGDNRVCAVPVRLRDLVAGLLCVIRASVLPALRIRVAYAVRVRAQLLRLAKVTTPHPAPPSYGGNACGHLCIGNHDNGIITPCLRTQIRESAPTVFPSRRRVWYADQPVETKCAHRCHRHRFSNVGVIFKRKLLIQSNLRLMDQS